MQAELHKDPHVKPDQVSISRSGACLSLHTRPSTHEAPYHVHGPGSASPASTPSIPSGTFDFCGRPLCLGSVNGIPLYKETQFLHSHLV